ncbi:S1 family peptidase [Frateuria defendens]|uniref:S1 family peptidase n=1 Tax=Frateuria defendens TaxID=2219559 RepID=UPI000A49A795|nr:serine protease [Frateuria defendens]
MRMAKAWVWNKAAGAANGDRRRWIAPLLGALGLCLAGSALAASPDPALLPKIQAATFEVVIPKAAKDPLTYEKPLPLDLLPYQERTDKYLSIGTAFALGGNRYVTAGHVLRAAFNDLAGAPALRDNSGKVYPIDRIEKFSLQQDFVVFSLAKPPGDAALAVDTKPASNSMVFAVGNALGTGVVIRDGLYTSDTPEDENGRWKWMRFSAAASPGNSGGPLLDQQGKVIGVVLMKSPNENLNYALPIGEVLKAPDHLAVMDKRIAYQLDVLPGLAQQGAIKQQFALPLSYQDFSRSYRQRVDAYTENQLKALLAQQGDQLFPRGAGASRLLHTVPRLNPFPLLIARNNDGIWGLSGRAVETRPLPANGVIQAGAAGRNILIHLRRPDDVPAADLYGDPKRMMDLVLQGGFLGRQVAGEKIRVVSLGKPLDDARHTDAWQRPWRVLTWALPYMNAELIAFALPVPDGYALMMRLGPAALAHDERLDLQALTDFVYIAYDGTLAQWKDYLKDDALLPVALKATHIDFDYGKRFAYDSPRLAFAYTPALQTIAPDNRLTLGLGYYEDHGKVVWDVGDVRVALTEHDPDRINIERNAAPSADLDDGFRSRWDKLLHAAHPFDGIAYSDNDEMRIAGLVPPPPNTTPGVLYTAFCGVQGAKPADEMKTKLGLLQKSLQVKEH